MEFVKLQGTGNDFILVEADGLVRNWPSLAVDMCDRHLGIGADSLLLVRLSDKADFRMQTFDADGSEAEICGNGLRCLVRYAIEKGKIAPDTEEITVETAAGISRLKQLRDNEKITGFYAIMGEPRFSAAEIPLDLEKGAGELVDINNIIGYRVNVEGLELMLYMVSMGNPHAVFFSDKPVKDFALSSIGPLVEYLPLFPHRTNFEIARVIGTDSIEARVWERGVGETMACGSGACAIAVVSRILGYTGNKVSVRLPGGALEVEYSDNGEVVLSGSAEIVFEGKWPD
ncbi:MAG: diaminopimelate epimerase [Dehalococcoidia bacterium]|jgi:diaminopimelate epimerase